MDIQTAQERADALVTVMVAKGMREPEATLYVRAHEEPQVFLSWKKGAKDGGYLSDNEYKSFVGDPVTAFDAADAFVAAQPDAAETKRADFLAALGAAIDVGRKNGIETEVLNPLVAQMKRLSTNAFTYETAA